MVQCVPHSPDRRSSPSILILPLLIDGDLGPEGANYTNTMVHAWHRSTGTVTIKYTLDMSTEIKHANLYFYSIASMGIGLPSVTVKGDNTVVEHYITGNEHIAQKDDTRRIVQLSQTSTFNSRTYTLQFDFENTDVDWLVLSETQLCSEPLAG